MISGKEEYKCDLVMYVVLTIVTCGIFNIYWNYKQMEACNRFLGREEFSFILWFVLSLITCGIYHIYYQYKMGLAITEIELANGLRPPDSLALLSCLVTIFGFSIVADCIHQVEINKIVDGIE